MIRNAEFCNLRAMETKKGRLAKHHSARSELLQAQHCINCRKDARCSAERAGASLQGKVKNSAMVMPSAQQISSSVAMVGVLALRQRLVSVECGMPDSLARR